MEQNQREREIALLSLIGVQILIFIAWILITIHCGKDLGIYGHIVFLLFTSFILYVITALAKSISCKEKNREELDLYKEKEEFIREIKKKYS